MKLISLFVAILFSAPSFATPVVTEFHIAAGTGENSWNTPATMIQVKIGDTLRIFNDDSIVHRLHTWGAPCLHGPDIPAGTSWDCVIITPYNNAITTNPIDGPLYDHYVGETARFYVEATAP